MVVSASGFMGLSCRCEVLVVFSRFELLSFLGLVNCVFLDLVLVRFSVWCWVFLGDNDCNGGFLSGVVVFFLFGFLGCVALFLMGFVVGC